MDITRELKRQISFAHTMYQRAEDVHKAKQAKRTAHIAQLEQQLAEAENAA
ncbi:hypothetical protein MG599_14475 [Paenarthrobacter sp. SD-1]|uniref:Uncharacterized protein n=1 Tax=Paenarthrobacter ureafaciens TaxID=37931 RepID=A0AAX3EDV1_PAEUR|nr:MULTISPECIES: hypothetical protein [Paenarthrobacter]MDO5876487.1 hypothetical protein [Paenarthrobacter sp. SD-1]UYV96260.1 hypothetical protein NL394_14450 [Paenarthrobacter ureafaciens]